MCNTILVVAAHADDEALGCGGTIARHIAQGDHVCVAFMTDGVSSRPPGTASGCEAEQRASAAMEAMEVLGVQDCRQFAFPDNQMDSIPLLQVTQAVEQVINEFKPTVVYTHFADDLNIDHRVTHQAVVTACRPQAWSPVKQIYCFEVLSSTEWNSQSAATFRPQYLVDISAHWEQKRMALQSYAKEMRPFPHSRSLECIEALAVLRGATVGLEKAEAFMIERVVESG